MGVYVYVSSVKARLDVLIESEPVVTFFRYLSEVGRRNLMFSLSSNVLSSDEEELTQFINDIFLVDTMEHGMNEMRDHAMG